MLTKLRLLRVPYRALYPVYHLGLRAVVRLLAPRLQVTGRHNIPHRGAVIFTPNHISDADPPLVGVAVRRPLYYMAKRELWDLPWLGPLITYLQAFPVDPESADRAALKRAGEILGGGDGLVLFPEGKIAHDGQLGEILPGAVLLALRSGAPVVPVGLVGADNLIPYGKIKPRLTWRKVHIHFGTPLRFDDLKEMPSREAREVATLRLRQGIEAAVLTAKLADG